MSLFLSVAEDASKPHVSSAAIHELFQALHSQEGPLLLQSCF